MLKNISFKEKKLFSFNVPKTDGGTKFCTNFIYFIDYKQYDKILVLGASLYN